jgi:hypothetical protein
MAAPEIGVEKEAEEKNPRLSGRRMERLCDGLESQSSLRGSRVGGGLCADGAHGRGHPSRIFRSESRGQINRLLMTFSSVLQCHNRD